MIMTSMAETQWSRLDDKLFERDLVMVPEDYPERWLRVAECVPGKSPRELREHYEDLVRDVLDIDSGRVELPTYADDDSDGPWDSPSQISFGSKTREAESERKKGTPWTEEEHECFLSLSLSMFSPYF
ncbi:hypothetical protein FH972_016636 [Carpinus fangiana]|uniref:Myb-like domain-containing protein n=1 Tax=Carpinus fangiana TaxID=176857 RepID=A0A5N6RHR8_9ROSI|nr:hypothetical protein FH972_016636 [Carpinus fangiana]